MVINPKICLHTAVEGRTGNQAIYFQHISAYYCCTVTPTQQESVVQSDFTKGKRNSSHDLNDTVSEPMKESLTVHERSEPILLP